MSKAMVFILGFIAGGLMTFFLIVLLSACILVNLTLGKKEKNGQLEKSQNEDVLQKEANEDKFLENKVLEKSNSSFKKRPVEKVQYIEVKGKMGNVLLYTGMDKDSVKMLLGKPDQSNLNEVGDKHYENWGYKINAKYSTDLDISFINGKLKSVYQR